MKSFIINFNSELFSQEFSLIEHFWLFVILLKRLKNLLGLQKHLLALLWKAIIEQNEGIVEVNSAILLFQLKSSLKSLAGGLKVAQSIQSDSHVHIAVREISFEIDSNAKKVVSRRVLLRRKMDQTKIKGSDPLEWVKIESPFQTGNRCNVFLFAKETHADVVPQLGSVGCLHCSHTVLHQCHVHVVVVLDDGPRRQDGLPRHKPSAHAHTSKGPGTYRSRIMRARGRHK